MFPNFHISIERWRKNEEYGVWVSTQGRVRLIQNKEFLNIRINEAGYCVVFTNKGPQYVHRLVAYTWLGGKRNEKYNIDHINSNKRDNSIKNLRWIEVQLNTDYAKYTQTNLKMDSIESIEQTEDFIKEFNNDPNKSGNILLKLFTENKINLFYNDTLVNEYQDILKAIKPGGKTPTKKDVFCHIAKAIRKTTPYGAVMWHFEKKEGI